MMMKKENMKTGQPGYQTVTILKKSFQYFLKMQNFTNLELVDMRFVQGFCKGQSLALERDDRRRYPNRSQPRRRLVENGNFRMNTIWKIFLTSLNIRTVLTFANIPATNVGCRINN